MELVIDFI